ncbi:MAG: sulfatase-like hydrolase/transferase [Planctomycetes bacterium]|nr:sulfatase-like hydrolase/transferase [Planctomycetota bacterium]
MDARQPNIVWMIADHYALAQFRRYASVFGLTTPASDRIATAGVRFDAAYSICPLCTPARGSMVTGQYPHRHGMTNNDGTHGSLREFGDAVEVFNRPLQRAGYRTGYFGKWHCGDRRLPRDFGFEGWSLPSYGYPYTAPEYRAYLDERGLPDPEVDIEWSSDRCETSLGRIQLMKEPNAFHRIETAGVLVSPLETHESHFVTHLANRWIEKRAAAGDRFCARVDVWGPHHPYWVAKPFAGMVPPGALSEYPTFSHDLADRPRHQQDFRTAYHAMAKTRTWAQWQPPLARCLEHVSLVEHALATVLDTLDRVGVSDNTLVILTADHGDLLSTNGGLVDKAWFMVEETMRIPMAMRWPGTFPEGRTSSALVSNMDVVPTVLAAAGCPLAADLDGRDLLPLARADEGVSWPDDLVCESHGHYGKLVIQRMLRHGIHKYVAHLDDTDELYDLSSDPVESTNRIDDPLLAQVLVEMRTRLLANMGRSRDQAPEVVRLVQRIQAQLPRRSDSVPVSARVGKSSH